MYYLLFADYLASSRLHTSVGLPIPIITIGFLYKHTRQALRLACRLDSLF